MSKARKTMPTTITMTIIMPIVETSTRGPNDPNVDTNPETACIAEY